MDINEQKLEAVEMATEYLDKLIPAMEQIVGELKGEQQEDTMDFLGQIIDGLNFMIETYNVTKDVVNGSEPLINDDALEACVDALSAGFAKGDYVAIADELGNNIVPFLKVFREAGKKIS